MAIIGRGLNKVEAPDMVWMFRSKPDAGAVIKPKRRPFWLPSRYSQLRTAPDALNPVLAHRHTTRFEQGSRPAAAVAAIVRCNKNDVLGQLILIRLQRWNVSLRPTRLPNNAVMLLPGSAAP